MNIAIFVNYIVPFVEAGDGYSALSEALQLRKVFSSVCIYSTISSATKCSFPQTFQKVVHGILVTCIPNNPTYIRGDIQPDIVLFHQPTCFLIAQSLANHYSVPLIYRQHINYHQLSQLARKLRVPKHLLINRTDPETIIKIENTIFNSVNSIIMPSHYSKHEQSLLPNSYVVPPRSLLPKVKCNDTIKVGQKIRIILGGRLTDPMKGWDRIYLLFSKLNHLMEHISIHLIGRIEDRHISALRSLAGKSLTVESWASNPKHVESVIIAGDIFISLSYYEPFGLMLADAIELGLLPLCTDVGVAYDALSAGGGTVISNSMNNEDIAVCAYATIENMLCSRSKWQAKLSLAQKNLDDYYQSSISISKCLTTILNGS